MAKKKFYIDKKEMLEEVIKSKDRDQVTNRLGEMFYLIAEKYSHSPMYREYERKYGRMFKEDLIAAGIEGCMKAWKKFDETKYDNPFSFFTTCIYRSYMGYLSTEYNYSNTKNALKVDQGMRGDYGYEEMMKDSDVEDEEEFDESVIEELAKEDEKEDEEESNSNEKDSDPDSDGKTSYERYKDNEKKEKDDNKNYSQKEHRYTHLDDITLWGHQINENKNTRLTKKNSLAIFDWKQIQQRRG